jgi:hypothetical protein
MLRRSHGTFNDTRLRVRADRRENAGVCATIGACYNEPRMKSSIAPLCRFALAASVAVTIASCGGIAVDHGDVQRGSGGAAGSGGSGVGGSDGVGGSFGVGGSYGPGGSFGVGGSIGSGGSFGVGGAIGKGGAAGAGGAIGKGGAAGVGGAIGKGGAAGVGGTTIPTCIPGQSANCACASGATGAQVCRADGTYGACVCELVDAGSWEQQQLARIQQGIVGTWTGTQNNPWEPTCKTTFIFESNGHYSAHSPGDYCVVLYYGTNDDSPEKTYRIDDVLANGDGAGEIILYWDAGTTNLGEVRHLALSADGHHLTFEVFNREYGPLVFDLVRS